MMGEAVITGNTGKLVDHLVWAEGVAKAYGPDVQVAVQKGADRWTYMADAENPDGEVQVIHTRNLRIIPAEVVVA
tara:strand:- start:275 stop:499 length:225 start_codon:yes stop_codon:yes gene_type:complete